METEPYSDWIPAIDRIIASGGRALVLGAVDTGKTTFCSLTVNRALESGRTVSVVDTDIGQSEIGLPACVGWGAAGSPIRGLADLPPSGLAFVGATSPRGNLLELVAAAHHAVNSASASAPYVTLIDTTGFVQGPAARRLKQAKLAVLRPGHVVLLQRKDECEHLVSGLKYRDDVHVHRLPVPPVVTRKSTAFRAQRRASRFARAFEASEMRFYAFENVALTGTWMNGGPPLAPHLLRFIANSLRLRAFYAEERDRHLGIVTNGIPAGEGGLAMVHEQFRTQGITVTPAVRLRHLLVGLSDHNDRMLGIGLIEAVDFRRRELGILTSVRSHGAVKIIHFGLLRLEPSGKELGHVRPGEV